MTRILLLGGTGDALQIARQLGPEHVYSLAGLGKVPSDLACSVRVGGFGGADGLARYLSDERIDLLVDATHPYAAQISVVPRTSRAGRCAAWPGSRRRATTGAWSTPGPN
jgi:precorrin-6A/cobalt-precorrin-6A reductase